MESESLEVFLNKVLNAGNAGELGGEVLGVLKQWKDELEAGEAIEVKEAGIEDSIEKANEENKEEHKDEGGYIKNN